MIVVDGLLDGLLNWLSRVLPLRFLVAFTIACVMTLAAGDVTFRLVGHYYPETRGDTTFVWTIGCLGPFLTIGLSISLYRTFFRVIADGKNQFQWYPLRSITVMLGIFGLLIVLPLIMVMSGIIPSH